MALLRKVELGLGRVITFKSVKVPCPISPWGWEYEVSLGGDDPDEIDRYYYFNRNREVYFDLKYIGLPNND